MTDGIPDKDITLKEAIDILKDIEVQNPLITLTKLGKAIQWAIKVLEETNE